MKFLAINRFSLLILLVLFCLSTVFAQKKTVYLSYSSEFPFQTENDNEYYHLEATLLTRQIISDMYQFLKKNRSENKMSSSPYLSEMIMEQSSQ